MGDVQEAIHLNRLLRLYPPGAEGGERWELEADPRHVEILVSQMRLSNGSKAVSTLDVTLLFFTLFTFYFLTVFFFFFLLFYF